MENNTRKEVKVAQSCLTLCNPMDYTVHRILHSSRDLPNSGIELRSPALQVDSSPAEPPDKPKNTGVGSLSLLQGIFPTWELNWGPLHCRQILYQLSYQGSPREQYKDSLKKLKLELPYDPGTPIMGIYLEKTIIQKD